RSHRLCHFVFSNDAAPTDIYTLSLHDALPIFPLVILAVLAAVGGLLNVPPALGGGHALADFLSPVFADSAAVTGAFHLDHSTERSEEHTSELQSRENLVCRLLLEKKNTIKSIH